MGSSQSNLPTTNKNKKKKDEKGGDESDHEKSDGELVVDDQNEVKKLCWNYLVTFASCS